MNFLGPLTNWWIDSWSFVHFLGWCFVTYIIVRKTLMNFKTAVFLGLLIGIAWEAIEKIAIEPFLGFSEPWHNKWVSDLIADSIGSAAGCWMLATRFKLLSRLKRIQTH